MTREWKPGDVAMVRFVNAASEHRAMRDADGKGWGVVSHAGSLEVADARPLVVIDPEDREQVERLYGLYARARVAGHPLGARDEAVPLGAIESLQAALREFADPKPPKPEEPTGLGAVVEDDRGELWIRRDTPSGAPWINAKGNAFPVEWPSIDAVRILAPGYDPEAGS